MDVGAVLTDYQARYKDVVKQLAMLDNTRQNLLQEAYRLEGAIQALEQLVGKTDKEPPNAIQDSPPPAAEGQAAAT